MPANPPPQSHYNPKDEREDAEHKGGFLQNVKDAFMGKKDEDSHEPQDSQEPRDANAWNEDRHEEFISSNDDKSFKPAKPQDDILFRTPAYLDNPKKREEGVSQSFADQKSSYKNSDASSSAQAKASGQENASGKSNAPWETYDNNKDLTI
eukprot:GILI01000210.1.p2 GENE.GILI01000210.1~~GILI01000210.1.p2  ORF type:complete len:151 (-),score=49.45 GILI01000210.1:109-561(-)